MIRLIVSAAFAVLLAACSSMSGMMGSSTMSGPAKTVDGMLVGANGMTLYTFDRDVAGSGKSVCNGPCATNWPPLMVTGDAKPMGDWTVVTRDDGGKQWAFKGKPLYFWVKDTKPGDKTGDGVNNAWRVARS